MIHSQEELDKLWLRLKRQPVSDYASERIAKDEDLVRELQLDFLVPSGSLAGTSRTITYTRKRENSDAEWGLWEEGYSAVA
jgi:hypothetical protein